MVDRGRIEYESRTNGRGRRRRPPAFGLLIGLAGLAVGLSGCAIVPPAGVTTAPSPSVSGGTVLSPSPGVSPSALPTASATVPATTAPVTSAPATPTAAPTTAAPTATPTGVPGAVKATGSMLTFSNVVSDELAGTCQTVKDAPTFTLTDAKNDFYGTVGVVVVLKPGREAVTSVRADFGEDFEGTKRKLVHPDTDTSATVSAKGSTYTVKGKILMYEGSSKKGSLVPFTITVTCAGDNW